MITVLLVDDEDTIVDVLRGVLEDEGMRCFTAPNGADALELLARESPSILVTDMMMPVMDGEELVQRVRADERWRRLPIVVMSAGMRRLPDELIAPGATLRKPFHIDPFLALVRRLIDESSAGD